MPPHCLRPRSIGLLSLASLLFLLSGCQKTQENPRLERLERRVQQLEQTKATQNTDPADAAGKPPAGVVKSLTFRIGSSDDRLRIYWSDGTTTNLPCTKEQGTWACG